MRFALKFGNIPLLKIAVFLMKGTACRGKTYYIGLVENEVSVAVSVCVIPTWIINRITRRGGALTLQATQRLTHRMSE